MGLIVNQHRVVKETDCRVKEMYVPRLIPPRPGRVSYFCFVSLFASVLIVNNCISTISVLARTEMNLESGKHCITIRTTNNIH